MVSQGESALKRQLQKSFKLVHQSVSSLEEQMTEAREIFSSLINLCEQFECCQAVEFESTPLRSHSDVKPRLLLKLSAEIELKTDKLRTMLCTQESFCERVSRQRQCVSELYEKYCHQVDLDSLVRRSVTQPSLADMIEWLNDTDDQLHQQLCCKQFLLENLKYEDSKTTEKLQQSWIHDDQVILKEILKQLDQSSYFMEEDL